MYKMKNGTQKYEHLAYLVLKSSAASLELSIWSRMLALPMVAAAIYREAQQWEAKILIKHLNVQSDTKKH